MKWAVLLLLQGCGYKVPLHVVPAGGIVRVADREVAAPVDVVVSPFRPSKVVVSAPGQRTMAVTIRWNCITMLRRSRAQEFRLVEQHGAAGTWSR
jgi:hypothetical protein